MGQFAGIVIAALTALFAAAQAWGFGEERVERKALRELELAARLRDPQLSQVLHRRAEERVGDMLTSGAARRGLRSAIAQGIALTLLAVVIAFVVTLGGVEGGTRTLWLVLAVIYTFVVPAIWYEAWRRSKVLKRVRAGRAR